MLDDLRNSATQSVEEESPPEEEALTQEPRQPKMLLGMTAQQRFILAVLLLFMTCALTTFCLLLTERIVLPIY